MPDEPKATDRRVRRTRRALQEALVALVIERGYEAVSIDDITERADVARGTFYVHYRDKQDLLNAVFSPLIEDLVSRLSFGVGSLDAAAARTEVIDGLYRHAEGLRDLYRVCLSGAGDGRARDAYVGLIEKLVEHNFSARIAALGTTPRFPVAIMAAAIAPAHSALLRSWLEGEIAVSLEEMVELELGLFAGGFAWGHGMTFPDVEVWIGEHRR